MIKNRIGTFFGIRFKFVAAFFSAFLLAAFTQLAVFLFLALIMMSKLHPVLEWMNRHIIIFLFSQLLCYILLTLFYYWLLTKKRMDYFKEIQKGIHCVAKGDFDILLPSYGNDELEFLAMSSDLALNTITGKFKSCRM